MKNIRFIIRGINDEDGIINSVIEELGKHYSVEKGIVYDWREKQISRCKGNIEYKRHRALNSHDCLEFYQEMPPIDGELLEKLLPYKDMAMHVMCRELHYDIYERRYLEKVFYKAVKYWNNEIEKNKINLVLFMVLPHLYGDYILYALCRIKGIKTIMLYPQLTNKGIGFFIGNTLENIGDSIGERYRSLKGENIELSNFMQEIYDNALKEIVMSFKDPREMNADVRKMFLAQNSSKVIIKDALRYAKIKLNILKMNNKKQSLEYFGRLLKLRLKSRKYEKKMDHISDYEKLAKKIDDGEKFIYVPLHLQPEASTLPKAGVYVDQMIMLSMLSEVAQKYGFKIYVKEHYVQVNREPGFYEEMASLPNTRLITLEENSLNLIRKSVAVASMTGNCLLEALINKKVAIAFGEGYTFKGAPNIISVKSTKDLYDAINKVMNNNIEINDDMIIRYLKAIEQEMIYSYTDSLEETYKDYDKKITAKQIVSFICKEK